MTNLLHIDTSPRGARSRSRRLTQEFIEAWRRVCPATSYRYRDLGANPPPHVDEAWIAAAFAPPTERSADMVASLQTSDELVDEFVAADTFVIGVPMYNFLIPANFKAYIDQVVRIGRTFLFEPEDEGQPYKPLLRDKRAYFVVATGDSGYAAGGRFEPFNHVDPYLRTLFGFIGITDVHFVYVENDAYDGGGLTQSLARARSRIRHLVATAADLRGAECRHA